MRGDVELLRPSDVVDPTGRWEDLPRAYQVALGAGVGSAPVRVVNRYDSAGREVWDVWDMRTVQGRLRRLLSRPDRVEARPVLIEAAVPTFDDAMRVAYDVQKSATSVVLSGGMPWRDR